MSEILCTDCAKLQIQLSEKDAEIKKLSLQIQNLTKTLQSYEGRSCHKCYCSKEDSNEHYENCTINNKKIYCNIDSPVLFSPKFEETENSSTLETICEKDNSTVEHDSEATNKFQSSNEYVYDENYKMYYCVSTGYYYDRNTGLYYVPENGAYYTYDYSKNAYVLYNEHKTTTDFNKNQNQISKANNILVNDQNKESEKESSKADDSCESVVDQVNNLNINDVDRCIYSTSSLIVTEDVHTETYNAAEEKTTCLESPQNATYGNLSNAWDTPVGSNQTVQDLVREVAEQNSGISDYIYDEKYQMYHSTSTGYYYDAVKKLLYDPQSGIYYKYDEDTSSYDFYYQVDLNAINAEKNAKEATRKVKARRRFWRKKLTVPEENISDFPKHSIKMDDHEENYSSPEEGELFSSESDQETESQSERNSCLENSSNSYSPCIRAIVKESTKLKIGTLILITCSGAIIGRGKTNAIHIPEVGVSKAHAEVSFNNELWKYTIKDLGSQNGTFVNGSRLSEAKDLSPPCVLNHGDIVCVGSCKLMFHIHVGYETCDECEPGQVMAEEPSKEEKMTSVFKTKEEKEKERRQEVRRLKKKYGLESMGFEEVKNCATLNYEDKADIRRKTIGSENPYEKTETSSLERTVNESNKGYQMLKKLGWKEGDSLGTTGLGISEPIPLRPWLSKAGLGSTEEQKASMITVAQDKRNKKWILAQERFLKLT